MCHVCCHSNQGGNRMKGRRFARGLIGAHKPFKYNDFTLIELMIVVSIIMILASLLLPALTQARQMAYQSVCAGNMKQIYTAFSLYVDDNNGHFPTSLNSDGDRMWGQLFHLRIAPYLNITERKEGALKCPANKETSAYNYAYNSRMSDPRWNTFTARTWSPEAFLATDGCLETATTASESISDPTRFTPVHRGGMNILFLNSSVAWFKFPVDTNKVNQW